MIVPPQLNQGGGPQVLGPPQHMQQAIQNHQAQQQAQQQAATAAIPQNHGPPGAAGQVNSWLEAPRVGSWPHVIDQISPRETLANLRYVRDLGPKPASSEPSKLKEISFQSCGYIRLPLDFDQTMLDPPVPIQGDTQAILKRRNDIEQYMMKPQDHALGVIMNHISAEEISTLENAWNLEMGWGESRKHLVAQALADGIRFAGQGRFRGKIEAISSSSI
jgi:hypothetical protein